MIPNKQGRYFEVVDKYRVSGTRKYKITIVCQCGSTKEKNLSYLNKNVYTCGVGCPISHLVKSASRKGSNFHQMLPKGESGFRRLLGVYKSRSSKYKREFSLSDVEFRSLTKGDCYYCGQEPKMVYAHIKKGISDVVRENGEYVYNSIDRIDSTLGYTIDNCRSSCKVCNNMKVNHSETDFLKFVEKIYTHLIEKKEVNMLERLHKHMCKNYHTYSFVANMLNAVSMAGLAYLGILTDTMTLNWLVGWGIMFTVLFGVGKLLNQEIDDMDKVKGHNCESNRDIEK